MASSTEKQVQEVVGLKSEAKVMYSGQICPVIGLGSFEYLWIIQGYSGSGLWSLIDECIWKRIM